MKIRMLVFTLLLLPATSFSASYDCNKMSLLPDEKTICDDRTLNDMDVKMATMYHFVQDFYGMGSQGAMREDQAAWLAERRKCKTNKPCLRDAYLERIEAINKIYNNIKK